MGQQRTHRVFLGLLAFCIAHLSGLGAAHANEPISYAVNARIHVEDGVVVGAMHTEVWVDEGAEEVRFWLYADRNAVAPSAMDEMSARWIYPGEESLGGIVVSDVRVDEAAAPHRVERAAPGTVRGRDFMGGDLVIPVPEGPRRPVSVRMRFVIDLPTRYGRVGRVGDRFTLAGPWYPLLVDGDAFHFRVPHRVRVDTSGPLELLVGAERVAAGTYVTRRAPYVPVIGAPELHERVVRTADGRMRIYSADPLYTQPGPEAEGVQALDDVIRIDVPNLMREATDEAYLTLDEAATPHRHGDIVVAIVPSRVELATTAPGLILASDNIYEIFPLEVSREFHHRAFRRALFRHLVEPISDRFERPADADWVDDLRAVFLIDVDDARRNGVARTPAELVGFAAFHPSIDSLLYAPQVQYVETFFGAIDEPDPFRDDPVRARRHLARGRRLLESARDALDEDEYRAFTSGLVAGARAVPDLLEDIDPDAAARLPVWLDTPNLRVNYRYGEISSEPHPSGGYINRVEVFRDGADRPEPVEVLIEDEDGNQETVIWDGAGSRGVVEAHMPAPVDDVHVDPRHRLPQDPNIADGHPRGDDATSKPWRLPLITGFALNFALSEGQVYGSLSFAMRRRYDLDTSFAFSLFHTSGTTGGTARYVRGVGPKRTTNSRIASVSGGLAFDRVRSGFVGEEEGGWRLSLVANAGFDTRTYFVDPREGSSLGLGGRVGGVARDDGSFGVTGSVYIRGTHTVTLGLLNMVLLVGGFGWTFGDALNGELQQLGGRFLLRGFETRELVGRGKAYVVAEHRYTPVRDLRWNLLHLAWLREIQIAFWTGAGMTFESVRTAAGVPDGGIRYAAEVGGGLRFHFAYAGVQPGVFSVDVGVPLTREPNDVGSDGILNGARVPVGLYLTFDQYF